MIKTIYDLEPNCFVDEDNGLCIAKLTFQGKEYIGKAQTAPEDMPFFSEKVGLNIATSRAIIQILKEKYNEARLIHKIKFQMYQEATNNGKIDRSIVDPTRVFATKVYKAKDNVIRLRKALKKEKASLNHYLNSLDNMIHAVTDIRERTK